jgi:hypothetical protein
MRPKPPQRNRCITIALQERELHRQALLTSSPPSMPFTTKYREHPIGSLLYTISCMHCMTVSLAQGGDGLGAMWGKEMAVQYLQEAGFHSVEVHELAHDLQNYYYVCRP